ncbi:hypothetical protein E4U17_001787 [Claviceps sp. LM77 group G4]|nr:hypothetical protein E4U17_001787 [Claviceps sp. LM77 group G4]KAG6071413.1 hypothetical protein E4U33_003721 [Claviceps sp. LM78 group G4]KAG6080899.1 hypothetical protein E4U16_008057 [Claviceps sp. LM84 group G4]
MVNMPLEETVTIVNNSGKIISTGKQLMSIFREAKASYDEKKAEIKALKRAETYDHASGLQRKDDHHHRPRTLARHATYEPGRYTEYDDRKIPHRQDDRRRSLDMHSETGSRRSHRGSHAPSRSPSHSNHDRPRSRSRPALTASNLKTLSEISSTAPSQTPYRPPAQKTYRSPYAETLPKDSRISWMNLTQCGTAKLSAEPQPDWRQSTIVPRRQSEPEFARHDQTYVSKGADTGKEIDMHLAYGDVPPDLADMVDLDPAMADEYQANQLVRRIEGLLDEAHCVQHSATSMIKRLQENPDAAAAVALTLADLSSVIGKMSPAFIGFLKNASPAVFSLLASPQFLIGTGIAVGLTVVMFGGWKIVKRAHEQQQVTRAAAAAAAAHRPALLRSQSENQASGMIEEALIVDDELSSIESWRRGILPPGADNESAEIELITPVADRAQRHKHGKDDFEVSSHRSARTARTDKTAKTGKTSKTTKTSKSSNTHKASKTEKPKSSSSSSKGKEREHPAPDADGWISRRATVETVYGADSELGIYRPSKWDRDDRSRSRDRSVKKVEGGRSNGMELVYRPRAQNQGDNMLKALFKNKDRKERESRREAVMA